MPFSSDQQHPKILAIATQGDGSGDADRLSTLLSKVQAQMYPFDRRAKPKAFVELVRYLFRERPDLVVMEGTGIAGGMALIIGQVLGSIPYVVSSGDAVGPYVSKFHPVIGLVFSLYERMLCRFSAGFIGWTPYLVGRALTFGSPRGMTAAGWAPVQKTDSELQAARARIRSELGIPDDHIVIGIAGSLTWNKRVGYCYGHELVNAILATNRQDIEVLIVGDGSGRDELERLAGEQAGRRIHFSGRVARQEVPDYLVAMDAVSLPQSVDKVGNFRYTTKVSEYMSVRLPIITGHLPLAYDFPKDYFWRLSGKTPWDREYIQSLTQWMNEVTQLKLQQKRTALQRVSSTPFDKMQQIDSVTDFVRDVIAENRNPFLVASYPNLMDSEEFVG